MPDHLPVRPLVAVSSCLLGEPVRFNAGHSRDRFLAGTLSGYVDWVPVCPEMEIGLGTPRESMRLEASHGGVRLITGRSRADLTAPMTALAAARAAELDVDGYVFKAKSPSCGIHGVPLYSGETLVHRQNRGLFAEALIRARPLLPVEDEGRLHDAVLREAFIERIFAHARLRALFTGEWRPRDLVDFHSRHKMQLLAHDVEAYHALGRLVATAGTVGKAESPGTEGTAATPGATGTAGTAGTAGTTAATPRERLAAAYTRTFQAALATRSSIGRHVNVLEHCVGMLGDRIDPVRRADLHDVIRSYRERRVPLSVPMALLRHHACGEDAGYVRGQTYLCPYPEGLALRNHVQPAG